MPDWKQYVRTHLRSLRVKPEREIEIIDELAAQLELAYQDAIAGGQAPAEAERAAKAQLPDWPKLAREIEWSQPPKHQPPARIWQGIPADLRHALRALRKSPVFSIVAIATLALGIGGCTAIFSLIEAVLLRPIGYPESDKLVMVWENQYRRGFHNNSVAMANYLDWKARNHVLSDMSPVLDQIWNVTDQGEPAVSKGLSVNERFLPMLGVQPLVGRSFTEEEARDGGPQVVILSHRFWVSHLGASRDAIGQTIKLDGNPREIIGILPADFPWLGTPLDMITPTQFPKRDWRARAGRFLRVVARIKPGVSAAQAQTELNTIARQLEIEYPVFNKDWGVQIVPLAEHFAGGVNTSLWVLMGAVGLVLLIACSNVANLTLTRAVAREREIAVRAALGATAQLLVRLMMVESLVISITGGILGCAGAYAVIRLIQTLGPQDVARLDSAGLNIPVVVFAVLASIVTGLAFGLPAAFPTMRLNLGATLKDGGRGVMNTIRGERVRGIFVVAQVGLAMVLLTGAVLLIESLYRLSSVPTGFDSHNVLTGMVMIPGPPAPRGQPIGAPMGESVDVLCNRMVERLRTLPGVESAGFITFLPFTGLGAATDFAVVGRPPYTVGQVPVADVRSVQPAYFETMRIPLRRGRTFTDADNRASAPRTFVVNDAMVRQMFENQDPIGQSLVVQMGDDKPGQIIGVVADTKHLSLEGEVRAMVYYPQAHLPISFGTFVIRTKSDPAPMASAMTAAIQEIKKDQPVSEIKTMDERIASSIARMRLQTSLLTGFAIVAVLLAVIGVYGVMAYSVEQRSHEIGVRLALGAEPRQLRRWITQRGLRLASIGLAAGLVAAFGSTRVLTSLLFDIKPNDPLTLLGASMALAVACMFASYLPARRATLVDPAITLRGE